LSGSVGATYSITDEILIKANLARGYRSPNINEVGANGLDPGAHIRYEGNRSFVPEFNFQKDLSFLAYLKNMDISLEIFNNQISNYIFQARLSDQNGNPVLDAEGNMTYRYQQSKARLYGGEFSFVLHPHRLKWFNLSNSLSYVKGLNKNGELTKQFGDAAKYLPFILPLHFRSELKASVQKSYRFFSGLYIKVEMDFYAKQDNIYAVDNTETATPSFTLFNFGAGGNIKAKTGRTAARIYLQVINLFDKSYQSHLNRLKYFEYYQASPNGRMGIYNMGRNINFKVIIPF
jgi:iron complex outermembrane receptor protein